MTGSIYPWVGWNIPMGEVTFGHRGKVASSVKFPYTSRGLRAMRYAEKIVRSIASRAKGKGAKKLVNYRQLGGK